MGKKKVLAWSMAMVSCAALALPEASYLTETGVLELPGVVVDGRFAVNARLSLAAENGYRFRLQSHQPSDEFGAVTFESASGLLRLPSVRLLDGSGQVLARYAADLALQPGSSPYTFNLMRAEQNVSSYRYGEEAAKVAGWLKVLPPVANQDNAFGLIGALSLLSMGGPAADFIRANGVAAFYADGQQLDAARQRISERIRVIGPMYQASGTSMLREVQTFPWGMLEPQPGVYNFSLIDHTVNQAHDYNLDYMGTLMPFADWDLAAHGPADPICQHFFEEDYPYLAKQGSMDRYRDLDAFIELIGRIVERYDGDGIEDMPGLRRPIRHWQIHNEPEGASCGQFRDDEAAFLTLMQRAYRQVKDACADCLVLNGGGMLTDASKEGGDFWDNYAALGGAPYQDIIAIHFNEGKHGGDTPELQEQRVAHLKALLGDKPVWMTEYGAVIGDTGDPRFLGKSEWEAAAWYLRYYSSGLYAGVERFFSDNQSFVNVTASGQGEVALPYYVNRLLNHLLAGFSEATKLATGQYRFRVGDRLVYALWNGVPAELKGAVTRYDLYGNPAQVDAASLSASADQPLLVVVAG